MIPPTRAPIATVFAAALVAALVGCGTPRPAPPTPSVPLPPVPVAPATRTTLAGEKVRLAALFRGTPVNFSTQQDGSLRATVPRRFSFGAGATKVMPPLAAVLDRLAKSQLESASRMRVSAPLDPDSRGGTLARDRAQSVRDYLIRQGIAPTRLQAIGVTQTEQVEIVVSEAR